MRYGRQAVAAILAVMMLLTGLPAVAAAPRETGPFDGIYQGESPEGGTEVPVGTGQPHTTLRSVLEDGGLSGDIIVRLTGDQTETQTESTGPLVVPERFTSLTITADTPVELSLEETHSRTQYIAIFANGRNLTIGKNVTLTMLATPVYLFGGNWEKTAVGSPTIVINGELQGIVVGGGYNGQLIGDTTIIVNNKIRAAYGGGFAKVYDGDYDPTVRTADASMTGSTAIWVSDTGVVYATNSYFAGIVGGGRAISSNTVETDERFAAVADVSGSVTIQVDGKVAALNGGGFAGNGTVNYNDQFTVRSSDLSADVGGDVSITIGPDGQNPSSSSGMELYGGGQAFARTGSTAHANVKGGVFVSAMEDSTAAVSQPDGKSFTTLTGGGHARGEGAVANVASTDVWTVRPVWESQMGVVGGGYARNGGTANVTGRSSVTVGGIEGQKANYENANAVFGGGFVGFYSDPYVQKPSIANVGSAKVTIQKSTRYAGGNNYRAALVGGGFVHGDAALNPDNDEYNKLPYQADVLGDTWVILEPGAKVIENITGGGTVFCRGRANVNGTAHIVVGEGAEINMLIGGGRTTGSNTVSGATIQANVEGSVSIEVQGKFTTNSSFIGGGYAATAGSTATVGLEGHPTGVTATFTGSSAEESLLTFSGYFYGAGSAAAGADAQVYGDVRSVFQNVTSGSWIWGGGSGKGAGVIGNTTVELRNSNMKNVVLGGGWDSSVSGTSAVRALDSTCDTLYGGGYGGAQSGSTELTLQNSTVTVAARGGGWDSTVSGTASITLADSIVNKLCGGGYGNSTTNAARVQIVGATELLLTKDDNTTLTNGVTVQVGDGTTETVANAVYLYDSRVTKVHISPNAVLNHQWNNGDALFFNVYDLQIDQGGTLSILNKDETVNGNFTGGGTLRMAADKTLKISGAVTGTTQVEMAGPVAGQDIITAAADSEGTFRLLSESQYLIKSQKNGKTVWTVADKIPLTLEGGAHGTVTLEDGTELTSERVNYLLPGQYPIAIIPNYGYKLNSVHLNGQDILDQLQDGVYTLTAEAASTLEVKFVPLEVPDFSGLVDSLPDPTLPDAQPDSILEAKLHYEALPEETKAALPENTVTSLNQKLALHPNIKVDVSKTTDAADVLTDSHMLLQSMTFEDTEALKRGLFTSYQLTLVISEAPGLTPEQEEALNGALEKQKPGKHFAVKVEKTTATPDETKTEPLPELRTPVTLVFDVSDQKPSASYQRTWKVLNLHETGGGIIPHIYEDEDKDPNTVTVTSNKFSVYSLVYQDTRKPDDDANFFVITAKAGEGGSVSPEGTVSAPQGSNQTFTITPEDGYEVADVLVDGQSVGAVERYTFERVNKSHTLRAVFQKAGTGWNPFEDVAAGDWFHDSVKALYERGLMAGTTPTRFSPDLFTSRAMLATILWRQAGQPAGGDALFPDVDPDSYYAKAVAWANGKGIFLGYDDGLFRPDALITREQLAAVLYREAGSPETAGMALGEFADGGSVSGWARQAMLWAVQQGIVTGRDNGTLDPGGNATRAETAAMLQRYWNY